MSKNIFTNVVPFPVKRTKTINQIVREHNEGVDQFKATLDYLLKKTRSYAFSQGFLVGTTFCGVINVILQYWRGT